MAFNGTGTFNRLYSWLTDAANNVYVRADRMDDEMDGMATGLSNCITRDGQGGATANIPFNNFRITGLGNGVANSDALNYGQVFGSTSLNFNSATFYSLTVTNTVSTNFSSGNVNITGGTITGIVGFSVPDFLIINAGVI